LLLCKPSLGLEHFWFGKFLLLPVSFFLFTTKIELTMIYDFLLPFLSILSCFRVFLVYGCVQVKKEKGRKKVTSEKRLVI
jgi:hypothetical protein